MCLLRNYQNYCTGQEIELVQLKVKYAESRYEDL